MITSLFTKTVETKYQVETVLVAEYLNSLYSIKKVDRKDLPEGTIQKYRYNIDEWYAHSGNSIELIEALKCFLGLDADVPEDFEFDHP